MRRSEERILTTHTGSLPRPAGVPLPGTAAASSGASVSEEELRQVVADTVRRQVRAGVDVVNDGEVGKPSYATYVVNRLTGFDGTASQTVMLEEATEFPEYFARLAPSISSATTNPACTGPVRYRDRSELDRDIANLLEAVKGVDVTEAFMTAASPGVIALFMTNQHYRTHEEYIVALADAMKQEYDAIHAAGLILQLDCPDLAPMAGRRSQRQDARRLPALSGPARRGHQRRHPRHPPEAMRMHVCWGNYEGPHNHDIALARDHRHRAPARPTGLLFEAANPRHEHEWAIFEDVGSPTARSSSRRPRLDQQLHRAPRARRPAHRALARLVGRENVMAGSDCGFATFAQVMPVDPRITWAKLAAMAEGARLASDRLW